MESVYIPVKEMLSNARGFRSLYAKREIHFEEVYRDILDRAYLPALRGPMDSRRERILTSLREAIGGEVAVENEGVLPAEQTRGFSSSPWLRRASASWRCCGC